jgi:hypothetical protein
VFLVPLKLFCCGPPRWCYWLPRSSISARSEHAGRNGYTQQLKRIPRPIFPPVQERETRSVNFRFRCYFFTVSRTVSLAPPTAFCTLPAAFSPAPSACVLSSPVTLPTVSSLHPLSDERRPRCDFCPRLFSYVVQRPELGLTWVSLLEPCCCCWAFSRACLVAS